MSLPRYPEYKPSGVEWLGEVPGHWEVCKLSHFFRAGKGKNGQLLTKEFCGANEGEYPVYSGQTENDGVMGTWGQFEFDFGNTGVLFATTVGAKAMHLRQLFGRFSLSQNCMIIWATSERCTTRFFFYHIQPLFQFQRALIPEHMQASFRIEDLYTYNIAIPPLSEQTQIAAFLDRETAKIDELVAEQRRLMELLKEKRQAVISHAVTQGLNPHAPMKPSGIEWLGDVPAHWNIGGLTRFIGPVVDYRGRTPTKVDDGVFLVTARNIRGGRIDYDASEEFVDPESAASLLARGRPEIGDLLFTMEAPLGQVALIDRVDIALAQRVVKFRGHPNVMRNDYLLYWFMSSACQARLETLATGSTALGIKASKLGMIECLVPPTDEQLSIVSHIEREAAILDTLTAEAQRAIDLLQERRTALISAAVTGQIDVRQLSQTQKVGAGETATQEASKLVNLPHENHT